MTGDVLRIENLTVAFPNRFSTFTAVDDVSLAVKPGEIIGLIGESGAGKSTIGNAVIGLLEKPGHVAGGRMLLSAGASGERDLAALPEREMAALRGREIGMVFQDPMTSLNPLLTIGDQLSETIAHAQGLPRAAAWADAMRRLADVGIPDVETRMRQYPHEFSGGMRQRVVIALALAGDPSLLIADEPTTALDVSIQKQILDLIKALCRERNLAVILVTHDMGVIAETADRVYVMRHGRVVETGAAAAVIGAPREAYTRQLIAAIPRIDAKDPRYSQRRAAAPAAEIRAIDAWLMADKPQPAEARASDQPYLRCAEVSKEFVVKPSILPSQRSVFRAVDGVSLEIARGEILGLVGESGSGKSTLGRMAIGLTDITGGAVSYADHGDLAALRDSQAKRRFRRDVQVVFQDPYSSLNPRLRVDSILREPILFHGLAGKKEAEDLVAALLERVGLKPEDGRKFPHQFSGGQRQRICIARALAARPRFLLCDEPTSALDVSIQAEVLDLLMELKWALGLTMLFVSHDLAVIRQLSDRVAVMRRGALVEVQETEALFQSPRDGYTQMLLDTAPRITPRKASAPCPDVVAGL